MRTEDKKLQEQFKNAIFWTALGNRLDFCSLMKRAIFRIIISITFFQIQPMMIDYLMEAFDPNVIREQWNVEENNSLYPPRHVGYVLNMFLWNHDDPKDIARVLAYFLLDIRDIVTDEQK